MRRKPWLTCLVAVVTAVGLLVQELVPGTLGALERTPAALHGEVWRWVTSLVVQEGGLAGGAFNITALLVVGSALERRVPRGTWLVAYLVGGLVGQVFGQLWQPAGGGNSVAVCGLLGLLAVVLVARPDPSTPRPAAYVLAVGCTGLAVALVAAKDVHGGALATSLMLATLAVRVGAIDIL